MRLRYFIGKCLLNVPIIRNKVFVYKLLGVNVMPVENDARLVKNNADQILAIHNPTVVGDYHYLYLYDNPRINKNCFLLLRHKVEIGYNTGLAYGVTILTSGNANNKLNSVYPPKQAPVKIGHDCWIGANSTILPGVTIGDYVVVAAGSVVTKDVPSKVLVAGNPAVVKKQLNIE